MKYDFCVDSVTKSAAPNIRHGNGFGNFGDTCLVAVGVGKTKQEACLDAIAHFEHIGVRCRGKKRVDIIRKVRDTGAYQIDNSGCYYVAISAEKSFRLIAVRLPSLRSWQSIVTATINETLSYRRRNANTVR